MIKYEDPGAAVGPGGDKFTRFKVYGIITYPTGSPTLAAFYFAYRQFYYQEYGGGFPTINATASSFNYAPFTYNLTGAGGRNSFRNRIVADLVASASIIGPLTVTNNVTLAYGAGLDPLNPGNTVFRFLIEGTCNRTIPNNLLVWQEIDFATGNTSFTNNSWVLQFYTS